MHFATLLVFRVIIRTKVRGSSVDIATDYWLDGTGIESYRTSYERTLTTHDYMDFLRRARWKIDSLPARQRLVGNYLSILDT
jgi:hypothetical protein